MRKRTLGLILAGIAAVAYVRRRRGRSRSERLSPIGEPVPGDEPIDPEDVPEDA